MNVGEIAADQNLAVRLHGDGANRCVRTRALPRRKRKVQRAIRIQTGDAATAIAIESSKVAANDKLIAVGHGHGVDGRTGAKSRIKRGVQRTILVDKRDIILRNPVIG